MKVTGYNYGTGIAQPLYLSVDGANTYINPQGGLVGVGSTNVPTHALDVWGFLIASHVAGGNVVSETFGGTNSWAKLWARTPTQSWSIGSSNNFKPSWSEPELRKPARSKGVLDTVQAKRRSSPRTATT